MSASVVCLSHTDGAEGTAIGRLVADRLGFSYADESIIAEAAQAIGVYPEAVWQAERRGGGRILEVDFGRFERSDTLRDLVRVAIEKTADAGRVVIVAHAASFALAERTGVLRVLVTASIRTRAARYAAAEDIDSRQAAKELAESDKGRAAYLQRVYGVKTEGPADYDLVVNTDLLTIDRAASIIVGASIA
jgi:cytidylate kinase